jgi:hypothetical protein
MTELERALAALGRELEFPATPDFREPVGRRLHRRRRLRPVMFAVALGALALGVALAVPPARSAILRFFHIGAATVERVETLPPAEQRSLVSGLGPALPRRAAEARAQVDIRLPAGVTPSRYYAQPGVIATLVRFDGKRVLLAELQGDQVGLFKKFVGSETRVEPVDLGEFALWIQGGSHVLMWQFEGGELREARTRLAGNVLLWQQDGTTYRLEGALNKGQLLELARQITR